MPLRWHRDRTCLGWDLVCICLKTEWGLLRSISRVGRDQGRDRGQEDLKDCMRSNSYTGVMLSNFTFLSTKLSEDGVQKKMSSLCMELMKLRNKRDAKEKV